MNLEDLTNYGLSLTPPANLNYITENCFEAAYIISLCTKGYHMPLENTPLVVKGEINGIEIGW